MTDTVDLPIRDGMIRLGQALKLAALVDDGAAARAAIAAGEVTVDGVVETHRGRQLSAGTSIGFAGQVITLVASGEARPGSLTE